MHSFRSAALLLLCPLCLARRPSRRAGFDFTIRNIMRGPELYGRAPTNVRWSADGHWIYFQWNRARQPTGASRCGRIAFAPRRARSPSDSPTRSPTPRRRTSRTGTSSPDRRSRVVEALRRHLAREPARRQRAPSHADRRRRVAAHLLAPTAAPCTSCATNNAYSPLARRRRDAPAHRHPHRSRRRRTRRAPSDNADASSSSSASCSSRCAIALAADSVAKAERKAREAAGLQPIYMAATERVIADRRLAEWSRGAGAHRPAGAEPAPGRGAAVRDERRGTWRTCVRARRSATSVSRQRVLWMSLPVGRRHAAQAVRRRQPRGIVALPAGTTTARAPRCSPTPSNTRRGCSSTCAPTAPSFDDGGDAARQRVGRRSVQLVRGLVRRRPPALVRVGGDRLRASLHGRGRGRRPARAHRGEVGGARRRALARRARSSTSTPASPRRSSSSCIACR